MSPTRAQALVDCAAVCRNSAVLAEKLRSSGAALCAVVKADGYGHGVIACARAALAGGASWLAVAGSTEAEALRAAGIDARILVMGALTADELAQAVAADADLVIWDPAILAPLVSTAKAGSQVRVHVKFDSGMGRLGTRDADLLAELADAVAGDPRLELAGLMTHFATADERGDSHFPAALELFSKIAMALRARHPQLVVHAANSAAVLREPAAHFDMARCGVALYGLDPFGADPANEGLEPALRLSSYVAAVKRLNPGDSVGYGRTWVAREPSSIAVIPIGYGDGVRRGLGNRGEVLIRGRRRLLVGTVSMDNVTAEVDGEVEVGDEVVLIGIQGSGRILAEEVAQHLGTINYEVTCGISARVPRVHTDR